MHTSNTSVSQIKKEDSSQSHTEILDLSSDCSLIYQQLAEKSLLNAKSISMNKIGIFLAFLSISLMSDILNFNELSTLILFENQCFNFFSSSYENCIIPHICSDSNSQTHLSCYGTKQECHSYFTTKVRTISSSTGATMNSSAQNIMIRTEANYLSHLNLSKDKNICENNAKIKALQTYHLIGEIVGILVGSLIADSKGRKPTVMWFYRIETVLELVSYGLQSIESLNHLNIRYVSAFLRGLLIHSTRHVITVSFLETNPDVTSPYIDYFQIIYVMRLSFISIYFYSSFSGSFMFMFFAFFVVMFLYVFLGTTYLLESLRYLTEMRNEERLLEGIKAFCVDKVEGKKLELTALEHSGGKLPAEVEKKKLCNEVKKNIGVQFILEAIWEKEIKKQKFGLRVLIWLSFEMLYFFHRSRLMILYLSSSSLRFDLIAQEIVLSYIFVYIGGFIVQQFGGKKILISFMVVLTLIIGFNQINSLISEEGYLINNLRKKEKEEIATSLSYLLVFETYLIIICKQIFEMETIISLPSLYRSSVTGIFKVLGFAFILADMTVWDSFMGHEDYSLIFVFIILFSFGYFEVFEGKDTLFEFDLVANKEFIKNYSSKSAFNYILQGKKFIMAFRSEDKNK